MLKKRIKKFLRKNPGNRFQYLHRISSAYFKNKSGFYVFFLLCLSLVFLLLGIVLLFIPGPGLLFILLSLGPLLYLSKNLAKKIDDLEVFLHQLFKR